MNNNLNISHSPDDNFTLLHKGKFLMSKNRVKYPIKNNISRLISLSNYCDNFWNALKYDPQALTRFIFWYKGLLRIG
jgi:hypothetical protein